MWRENAWKLYTKPWFEGGATLSRQRERERERERAWCGNTKCEWKGSLRKVGRAFGGFEVGLQLRRLLPCRRQRRPHDLLDLQRSVRGGGSLVGWWLVGMHTISASRIAGLEGLDEVEEETGVHVTLGASGGRGRQAGRGQPKQKRADNHGWLPAARACASRALSCRQWFPSPVGLERFLARSYICQ